MIRCILALRRRLSRCEGLKMPPGMKPPSCPCTAASTSQIHRCTKRRRVLLRKWGFHVRAALRPLHLRSKSSVRRDSRRLDRKAEKREAGFVAVGEPALAYKHLGAPRVLRRRPRPSEGGGGNDHRGEGPRRDPRQRGEGGHSNTLRRLRATPTAISVWGAPTTSSP